ncbi:hypothetical protein Avbf_13607 [Armadillidium vulgare]|nr:hypothetical protein Avbf_13607 [Armadillidium vulgare]
MYIELPIKYTCCVESSCSSGCSGCSEEEDIEFSIVFETVEFELSSGVIQSPKASSMSTSSELNDQCLEQRYPPMLSALQQCPLVQQTNHLHRVHLAFFPKEDLHQRRS